MAEEVHVGDVGVQLEYELLKSVSGVVTPLDVSDASLIQLTYQRPSGLPLIVNASLINDGTDGLVKYITQPGDLNVKGNWKVQVYIEIDDKKFHSEIDSFVVYGNL